MLTIIIVSCFVLWLLLCCAIVRCNIYYRTSIQTCSFCFILLTWPFYFILLRFNFISVYLQNVIVTVPGKMALSRFWNVRHLLRIRDNNVKSKAFRPLIGVLSNFYPSTNSAEEYCDHQRLSVRLSERPSVRLSVCPSTLFKPQYNEAC